MPALTEMTSKNHRDYDIPLNERIVFDIFTNSHIDFPAEWKLYEKAFFTDKLKQVEIDLKTDTETYCNDLILAMKKASEARKFTFDPKNVKKSYDAAVEDYNNCHRKMCEIDPRNEDYRFVKGLSDPLKAATFKFNQILRIIDTNIIRCSTAIKAVDASEDVLNKVNYTDVFYDNEENSWIKLNEEQEKIIKSGKDLFSRESLSLNIKKLRTLRSRVLRIFNKHFGKDSIYAFANLQEYCK